MDMGKNIEYKTANKLSKFWPIWFTKMFPNFAHQTLATEWSVRPGVAKGGKYPKWTLSFGGFRGDNMAKKEPKL